MGGEAPSVFTRAARFAELSLMMTCWVWGWVAFVYLVWIEEPKKVGWHYQAAVYVLGAAITSAGGVAAYYTQSSWFAVISLFQIENLYFPYNGVSQFLTTGSEVHIDGLRLRSSLLKGVPMAMMGMVTSGWGLSAGAVCQAVLHQAEGRLHRECGDQRRQFEPADLRQVEGMTDDRMRILEKHSANDWNIDYNVMYNGNSAAGRLGLFTQRSVRIVNNLTLSHQCTNFVSASTAAWKMAHCRVDQIVADEVGELDFNERGTFFPASSRTIWEPHAMKGKFLAGVMPLYKKSIDEAFSSASWSLSGFDKFSFIRAASSMLKSSATKGPRVQLRYRTTWQRSGLFALFQVSNAHVALAKRGLAGRHASGGTQVLMIFHVVSEGVFTSAGLVTALVAVPAARAFQEAVRSSTNKINKLAKQSAMSLHEAYEYWHPSGWYAGWGEHGDKAALQTQSYAAERSRKFLMSLGEWMVDYMTPLMLPTWASLLSAGKIIALAFGFVAVATAVSLSAGGVPCAMRPLMMLVGIVGSPCVRLPGAPLVRSSVHCQLLAKTAGVVVLWLSPLLCGYEQGLVLSFEFLLDLDFHKGLYVLVVIGWAAVSLTTGLIAAHWLPEVEGRGGQCDEETHAAAHCGQATSLPQAWHGSPGTPQGPYPMMGYGTVARPLHAGFYGSPSAPSHYPAMGYGAVA